VLVFAGNVGAGQVVGSIGGLINGCSTLSQEESRTPIPKEKYSIDFFICIRSYL
jgi:hypothetical protein